MQLLRQVAAIPSTFDDWESEDSRYWYGGENSGGWCGWRIKREVWTTSNPGIYRVVDTRYHQNHSDYQMNEDDVEEVSEFWVEVVSRPTQELAQFLVDTIKRQGNIFWTEEEVAAKNLFGLEAQALVDDCVDQEILEANMTILNAYL